ncbi:MAG: APC family permease [Gammaproteobacteria bacterium]|nr:APC family permease [Gammaproteobacteria bacterium]MDH4313375.1 APC family permease [Gammaproteobacteria bacterium]MDH5213712.1 APC family permease [Gammaproteobacteria bacterium]MDH5502351.1 APC family permease [Gammaproteobacteria bacterium]
MTVEVRKQLIRGIGFVGIAIVVLNSMIGAGIFALPTSIASTAGNLSPWLFLLVGVLFISIVLSFAELASYFQNSGGPVLYTRTAFGPLVGFSTGWLLYVSRMAAFAANVTVIPIYLGTFWPWMTEGFGRALIISVVCIGLTIVNYIGLKDGIRTVAILTFLKLTPIVLMILLGLQYVTADTLIPKSLPKIEDMGATTLLLIYAFVGFESATIISGETVNPRRTMPRALVATVLGTALLYFLIVLIFISVLPNASSAGATLVDVGAKLAGPAGAIVITLAAIFSVTGNLSAIMLAVPRLTFALAEQRLLPRWFGEVHDRYATPGNSVLFLGALSLLFAISGSFAYLAAASSLTRLICYGLSIAALPSIRQQADEATMRDAYRLKGGYTIPAIALLLCVWIAFQSTADSWRLTAWLLVLGLVFYTLARQRGSDPAG